MKKPELIEKLKAAGIDIDGLSYQDMLKAFKALPVQEDPEPEVAEESKPATKCEQDIIDQIEKQMSEGWHCNLICVGRTKMVNKGEDILAYIQANPPFEISFMKSGQAAKNFQIS